MYSSIIDDTFASRWASWLSCQSESLSVQIRSDLGSDLSKEALAKILEFVREYRCNGINWSLRGVRGDQLITPMLCVQKEAPELFDFLCKKVSVAEKNKWVGGSLNEDILAQQMQYQKFVIVSTPRAGTHLLRTLLSSHPCIEMQGEAFNKFGQHLLPYSVQDTKIDTILNRHLFRPYFEYVEAVGFVLFRDLDTNWGGEDVWKAVAGIRDLKIILLDRKSRLARFVSLNKSLRDHIWYVGRDELRAISEDKVHVSCDDLIDFIDKDIENIAQFYSSFCYHDILPITYEALLSEPDAISASLLKFLGISVVRLLPGTGKKEKLSIDSVISNIEEIRLKLLGTKYEQYI